MLEMGLVPIQNGYYFCTSLVFISRKLVMVYAQTSLLAKGTLHTQCGNLGFY